MYNQDFFQKSKIESNITGDNNYVTNDMNIDVNMMNMNTEVGTRIKSFSRHFR